MRNDEVVPTSCWETQESWANFADWAQPWKLTDLGSVLRTQAVVVVELSFNVFVTVAVIYKLGTVPYPRPVPNPNLSNF